MIEISDIAKNLSSVDFIDKSLQTGESGEELFRKLTNIKRSNTHDDHNHIDCRLPFNNHMFLLDVKGFKQSQQLGYILIEMLNVRGDYGWCHSNSITTHIAFQFNDEFYIVNKKQLRLLVLSLSDPYQKDNVLRINRPTSEFSYENLKYKWMGRPQRKDIYTYITKDDLFSLDHIHLTKDNFTIRIKTENFNQRFMDFCE